MKYETLFSPVKMGRLTIKNRIVLPAMGTGMANFDGTPSEQLIAYYRKRAKSGTGLIISEITRINDLHGATMPRQLSMSRDRYIKPFSKYVDAIHEEGALFFCQLHHPGRQNLSVMVLFWPLLLFIGRLIPAFWNVFPKMVPYVLSFMDKVWAPRVVAPSAVPCGHTNQRTRALRKREIAKLVKDFVNGADRVRKAGADGVEIHGSHGYLIQQFLSPRTNRRTDNYGGSREKRMTFLLDIIKGIREACGKDFSISVRLTVNEYYPEGEEGISLDDGLYYAEQLERAGVDLLNISSGTYETMDTWLEPISFEPGWRKELARKVKDRVSIPVLGASFIRTPEQAEEQIIEGYQDLVALGRGQLADPLWTEKAANGDSELIRRCIACLNCFDSLNRNAAQGLPLQCSLNPQLGHEYEEKAMPGKNPGKAIVIGAGPAGLTAALKLSDQHYEVQVWEKSSTSGGQLKLAEVPPHKKKISWFYKDILANLAKNRVSIQHNMVISVESLRKEKPDLLVLATGGVPVTPSIKGVERESVYLYTSVLSKEVQVPCGNIVVVGSGMSGLETAEFLINGQRKISIMEMSDTIGEGIYKQNRDDVVNRLHSEGVAFHGGTKLIEIGDISLIVEKTADQSREEMEYDAVILALGVKSDRELRNNLLREFPELITIGDAVKPGRLFDAVHSAYDSLP